jgi:glc operon protein GlcG
MCIQTRRLFLLAAVVLLAAGSPGARAASRPTLSLAEARALAVAAAAEAKRDGSGGAIAIVDDGGHLVYLERPDGTFPAAARVATAKARTAATFRRATADFENAVKGGRTSVLAIPGMTPLEGGVPLVIDGQIVGAVGVSGASSAQRDEEIARAAAATLGRPKGD